MEKPKQNKVIDRTIFDKIAIIFLYLFLSELMLGCNGHWFWINVFGFDLTPRMIMFVILFLGYFYYLFAYQKIREEFTVFMVFIAFLFLYILIPLVVGLQKGFDKNIVVSNYSIKFYIISAIPLFAYRNNRFFSVRNIYFVSLACSLLSSLFCLGLFAYEKISGLSPDQMRYQMGLIIKKGFGEWGVYETGGVYLTSLIFVLYVSIATFCSLLFSNMVLSKKLPLLGCETVLVSALLQSSNRGFQLTLVLAMTAAIIIRSTTFFSKAKIENNKKTKEQYKKAGWLWIMTYVTLLLIGIVFLLQKNMLERFLNILSDPGVQYRLEFIKNGVGYAFSFPFLFGKGIGSCVLFVTSGRLEIDFLEVFIDEGAIGLFLWLFFFFWLFYLSFSLPKNKFAISLSIQLIVVAIVAISFTNPYATDYFGIVTVSILYALVGKETHSNIVSSIFDKTIYSFCKI